MPDEPEVDALLNGVLVVVCGIALLSPLALFVSSFTFAFCDNAGTHIRINVGAQVAAGVLAVTAAVRKSAGLALLSLSVGVGTFAILYATTANCSG